MSDQRIFRIDKQKNYTVIPNDLINDDNLSPAALGVLVYLLSKPNDWQVRDYELQSRFNIGREKLKRIVRELKISGYMSRWQHRDDNGKFITETLVFESANRGVKPADGKPADGKPADGKPADGKPVNLQNPESQNPESLSTESATTERESLPLSLPLMAKKQWGNSIQDPVLNLLDSFDGWLTFDQLKRVKQRVDTGNGAIFDPEKWIDVIFSFYPETAPALGLDEETAQNTGIKYSSVRWTDEERRLIEGQPQDSNPSRKQLTPRKQQVYHQLIEGLTIGEAAKNLGIADMTLYGHYQEIKKLIPIAELTTDTKLGDRRLVSALTNEEDDLFSH